MSSYRRSMVSMNQNTFWKFIYTSYVYEKYSRKRDSELSFSVTVSVVFHCSYGVFHVLSVVSYDVLLY